MGGTKTDQKNDEIRRPVGRTAVLNMADLKNTMLRRIARAGEAKV